MREAVVIHEEIETAYSVSMQCQHVHTSADHICWNCTMKIVSIAEAAEAERDNWHKAYDIAVETLEKKEAEAQKLQEQRDKAQSELYYIIGKIVTNIKETYKQEPADYFKTWATISVRLNEADFNRLIEAALK